MVKNFLILVLIFAFANSKSLTPNDVYSQAVLIEHEVEYLMNYYDIKHDDNKLKKILYVNTKLKPRNVLQKTYEILIKINILRDNHDLPIIEPINMPPTANLDPNLVYEQTQRILTELHIFKVRKGIKIPKAKVQTFKDKTPLDVFNLLSLISISFDILNKSEVTPSYVFGENLRVYDDIGLILDHLNIKDNTIPAKKNLKATPNDTFNTAMKILEKIRQLQIDAGIDFVDFNDFRKKVQTTGEVFSITQMIMSELQTIKAYLSIDNITPAAARYKTKTPSEVDQLMSWNLRKLELISSLRVRR
ncbi:MAG: hypothetical protein U9Q33_13415 [Campylobacterota bacterium]|nr:hypothetical protein [Campylobacterota bacterium]